MYCLPTRASNCWRQSLFSLGQDPARNTGANSLVVYSLAITDLNISQFRGSNTQLLHLTAGEDNFSVKKIMRASLRNVSINTQKIIKSKNWWMWSRYTWMQKIHQDSLVHTSEYLSRVSHTLCVCARVCLSVWKKGSQPGPRGKSCQFGSPEWVCKRTWHVVTASLCRQGHAERQAARVGDVGKDFARGEAWGMLEIK